MATLSRPGPARGVGFHGMVVMRTLGPGRVLGLVAVTAALMAGLVSAPVPADAGEHTAVRSLSADLVAPGAEVTVTVSSHDFGPFGRVSETLPEGWEYTGSSLVEAAVSIQDRTVRFLLIDELLDEGAFTYTVRAPETAGTHAFSGIIEDSDRVAETVSGATEIVVSRGAAEEGEACLRGPIVAGGYSLALVTAGGDDLETCANSLGVEALYALRDGEFVAWIAGAPEAANRPFLDLFPEGLPPLTALFVRGGEPPEGEAGAAEARLVPRSG